MAAEPAEISIVLGGLHCAACVARVERALKAVPGVLEARVNLATRKALVRYDPARVTVEDLKATVTQAGYQVESWTRAGELPAPAPQPEVETRALKRRFLLALSLSLPVFVLSLTYLFPTFSLGLSRETSHLLMFSLTTPVLFYAGAPFFVGALRAARHFSANMDSLVALGTSAAYGYSVWVTFFPAQSTMTPPR